ncbi:MAG: 2-amino-4-hydroxy-6-hydroxymethyldihydropteridine diphosphokinase [Chthoniobacterales bacterium]
MRAGIALGSNLGDRRINLLLAIENLKKIHQGPPSSFLSSSIHETEPLDCPVDSPDFLNAVIQLETDCSPRELLKQLQAIEVGFGRPPEHAHHAPRTIDLDLLYCEKLPSCFSDFIIESTSDLELPHPRIRERLFVLAPLVEIVPDIVLPGWTKTAKGYLLLLNK